MPKDTKAKSAKIKAAKPAKPAKAAKPAAKKRAPARKKALATFGLYGSDACSRIRSSTPQPSGSTAGFQIASRSS